jgi:hypothetical protein
MLIIIVWVSTTIVLVIYVEKFTLSVNIKCTTINQFHKNNTNNFQYIVSILMAINNKDKF